VVAVARGTADAPAAARPGKARPGPGSERVVAVATWNDVRRIALALPGTAEQSSRGIPQWRVRDKGFIWERPLRRADRRGPRGPPRRMGRSWPPG
jgi:hypothetical protein